MDYNLYILTIVFFISLILKKILINYSHKLKLIDKPNERSLHQVEKSRAGGIAIFLSFVVALVIAKVTGLSIPTMVLAAGPGGFSEMCITAKILQLGVPLVTAFQVTRLVIVVTFALPLWNLISKIKRNYFE